MVILLHPTQVVILWPVFLMDKLCSVPTISLVCTCGCTWWGPPRGPGWSGRCWPVSAWPEERPAVSATLCRCNFKAVHVFCLLYYWLLFSTCQLITVYFGDVIGLPDICTARDSRRIQFNLNHWNHCCQLGPYLRTQVPIGTFCQFGSLLGLYFFEKVLISSTFVIFTQKTKNT